jgi:hypothetical protein
MSIDVVTKNSLNQWISSFYAFNSNEKYVTDEIIKIIGPPSSPVIKSSDSIDQLYYITVKIADKVYIDSLDIYETSPSGILTQIEAQFDYGKTLIFQKKL